MGMSTSELLEFRANKDEFFGGSHQSPISHEDRHHWDGLNYFEPNETLSLRLEMADGDRSILSTQTSDGQARTYLRIGQISFEVDGQPVTLTVLQTDGDNDLFLPFRDSTSGKESYGAGRYLDLELNEDDTVTVDFNYAYNPYCAYSDAFSCPLPPVENWLQVPIRAGEAIYH